jgi:hypothetical protein
MSEKHETGTSGTSGTTGLPEKLKLRVRTEKSPPRTTMARKTVSQGGQPKVASSPIATELALRKRQFGSEKAPPPPAPPVAEASSPMASALALRKRRFGSEKAPPPPAPPEREAMPGEDGRDETSPQASAMAARKRQWGTRNAPPPPAPPMPPKVVSARAASSPIASAMWERKRRFRTHGAPAPPPPPPSAPRSAATRLASNPSRSVHVSRNGSVDINVGGGGTAEDGPAQARRPRLSLGAQFRAGFSSPKKRDRHGANTA